MDYFLAICQALGIALAVGALAGAPGPTGRTTMVFAIVGAAAGAAVAAVSMSVDDESIALAIPVGAAGGLLACTVVASVVAGAGSRSDGGVGAIGFIVALGAAALAGLSILIPPISLVALAALGWLGLSRRRRAQRKYEGLRILR